MARPGRMAMVALMLVATAAVGGCTPRRADMTAVLLDDGVPAAVFHPCGGSDVIEVGVSTTAGSPFASWSVANSGGAPGVSQVRLLEAPPGWVVQTAELTSLAEGVSYLVWTGTDRPAKGNDTGVTFTLADLSGLADGQVWAEADGNGTAMSRAEFDRRAKGACG